MNNQERLSTLISSLKQRDGGKFREDVEDSKKIIGREVGSIREVSRTFRHYRDQYPDTYKDFCEETKDAIQYVDEEGRNTGVKWYPVLWDYLAKPQVIIDLERWLKDGQSKRDIPDYKALNLAKVPISGLIEQGESYTLEFKETLDYDTQNKGKNKDIVLSSLKTIAGFLNAAGGTLLIGIDDSGKIKGIGRDLSIMKDGNNDKFELKIRNRLKDCFQPQPIGKVNISFENFRSETICRVDVQTSKDIIHLDNKVYVREGNTTQLLKGRTLTEWIQENKRKQ